MTKPRHLLKLSLACDALSELKLWVGFFPEVQLFGENIWFFLEVSARLSYFDCFIHSCRFLCNVCLLFGFGC